MPISKANQARANLEEMLKGKPWFLSVKKAMDADPGCNIYYLKVTVSYRDDEVDALTQELVDGFSIRVVKV